MTNLHKLYDFTRIRLEMTALFVFKQIVVGYFHEKSLKQGIRKNVRQKVKQLVLMHWKCYKSFTLINFQQNQKYLSGINH